MHHNLRMACSLGALALVAALSVSSGPAIAADKYASAADLGLMVGFPPPADKQVNRSNALVAIGGRTLERAVCGRGTE